jgi:hypothetical protein
MLSVQMNTLWCIDGGDLDDRTRSGGANALKGFDFQKSFALLRLVWLLTSKHGATEVRYEGAQDIDVRFGDGHQQLVQAKHYVLGNLKLGAIYDAIAGFTRDVICVRNRDGAAAALPRFTLLTTSPPVEAAALQLYRRVGTAKHSSKIATRVKHSYRHGLDKAAVKQCAVDALARTDFQVVLAETAQADFEALASWELIRFGVPPEYVRASLGRIEKLLAARASLQIEDVAAAIEGLPSRHPASKDARCRLLPSRGSLPGGALAKSQFLIGAAPGLWAAIANDLDVPRHESSGIHAEIASLAPSGGMLVVEGVGGSGKSTIARRIAWNLHRLGRAVAIDVPFPATVDDDDWRSITNLCDACERPILLVVDDIWRYPSFVEGADRNARPGLCVLATSRPGEEPTSATSQLAIVRKRLGGLDGDNLSALRKLVAPSMATTDDSTLRPLLEAGQIFVVSLLLQSGTKDLRDFASRLIDPLRKADSSQLEGFIDLCISGMHDHSTPLVVLTRRRGAGKPFWKSDRYVGLAFPTGDGLQRLRTGHALIAQAVIDAAGVSAVERALSICSACEISDGEERRFALRLLGNISLVDCNV